MTNLTPTIHGAWRVIDGQLVDESAGIACTPDGSTHEIHGAPGEPEPIEHVSDPGVSDIEPRTAGRGEPPPPIPPAPTARHKRASKAH